MESELASTLLAPKSLRMVTAAMKLKDTYSLEENLVADHGCGPDWYTVGKSGLEVK